jgi:hypothetical protein
MDLDQTSEEWDISRNKLLNLIVAFGLQNKDKLKEAITTGVSGSQVTSRVSTNTTPTPITPKPTTNCPNGGSTGGLNGGLRA